MCTVSNIVDFGRQMPPNSWDHNNWHQFQLLLQKMAEIDAKLGLIDCEDAAKKEWMKGIEERLAKLEKSAAMKPKSKRKLK
jgi:hypothetical protein